MTILPRFLEPHLEKTRKSVVVFQNSYVYRHIDDEKLTFATHGAPKTSNLLGCREPSARHSVGDGLKRNRFDAQPVGGHHE